MFVVESLKDIRSEQDLMATKLTDLRIKAAAWSALWGFLAGATPILVDLVLRWKSIVR